MTNSDQIKVDIRTYVERDAHQISTDLEVFLHVHYSLLEEKRCTIRSYGRCQLHCDCTHAQWFILLYTVCKLAHSVKATAELNCTIEGPI